MSIFSGETQYSVYKSIYTERFQFCKKIVLSFFCNFFHSYSFLITWVPVGFLYSLSPGWDYYCGNTERMTQGNAGLMQFKMDFCAEDNRWSVGGPWVSWTQWWKGAKIMESRDNSNTSAGATRGRMVAESKRGPWTFPWMSNVYQLPSSSMSDCLSSRHLRHHLRMEDGEGEVLNDFWVYTELTFLSP